MKLLAAIFQNRAWSCLEEADRAECPISKGKRHASGSKAHEAWCTAADCQVRRRRTSIFVRNLPIKKFLFEALAAFSSMTKLRTSARFLHGLSH